MALGALSFRYSWRVYQARILDRLDQYRDDRKIHIVAPPGAGKTVLGLEIMRRLNGRTLVLAPNLTIREQWIDRFRADFGGDPEDVATDLYAPATLTVVTYQALWAYHEKTGTDGLDWMETLVVDECHHLRREWWRVLDAVAERYNPELVALTATPPYDVSGIEWRRYYGFCGEIDEEISIPELVASGDLCPHQDYLYPILPPPGDGRLLREWQSRKEDLLKMAYTRSELAYLIRDHPWLQQPEEHYTEIFEHPEYFTSLLSVLRAQGSEPPAPALGVLHGEATLAPVLDGYWLRIFLERALRHDDYFGDKHAKPLLQPYRRGLSAMGAWDRGKLRLDEPLPPASGAAAEELESPQAKLEALVHITELESDALLDKLRLVILTDNIHDEYLPTTEYDRRPLLKVGTVPVFEVLRRRAGAYYARNLCLLSGSLVIIPQPVLIRLREIAYEQLPLETVITSRPLFPDSEYLVLDTATVANKHIVGWINQLFAEGGIHVIVGTKSLLGEGWDAPIVNSLILANRVGSFVLSNQMRGRAIRTVRGNPDKTANIWHPVVVHPDVDRGGPEVDRMRRRFRGFAGPRLVGKPAIQNGLERYNLQFSKNGGGSAASAVPALPAAASFRTTDAESMLELRELTEERATNRDDLARRWSEALGAGTQLVETIRPPAERYYERKDPLTLHYRESVDRHIEERYRMVLLQMKVACLVALVGALAGSMVALPLLPWIAAVIGGVGALYYVPRLLRLREAARPRLERSDRNPVFANEVDLSPHLGHPLIFVLLLLVSVGWQPPLVFVGVYFSWMVAQTAFRPELKRNEAARRHTLLADTRSRLFAYGRALAESLHRGSHFHSATPDRLRLEEEAGEEIVFLSEAEHHDGQLFAGALGELMSPVDNPRYLLRMKLPDDWTRGEYYLGVPAALGNRKDADRLAELLSGVVEQEFEAIYTREPAGRLHLLTARLQASSKVASEGARREQRWR
ncbi:type III restriction/modification enzyme restriction subunit [Neolewinella xylanilytica]|uniref:Type III restriction/modification enzyme restriction subunit n=1 Tax=Neolewinella xylanilytica TaxID=1514080 RepID=A0A2S6I9P3_9BACT|nr:DEAD/DEAH box helicase family protein [Neolewinella xylanilytica]PPK88227.1 type III restriction/modification enzyme restriction subunit [Neolewinella xylanilytica]